MGKKLDLNYFTGQEADQFNFIKIPKPLLYDPIYADLKIAEIITYSRMLDRMNLSIKNGWFDEMGRAFIFCSLKDVMEFADCGKNKAVDIMKSLENIGLIEKVKGAPGTGTKVYVKNFIPKDHQKFTNQTCAVTEELDDVDSSAEVWKSNHETSEKQTSEIPENKLPEVWKSNPNNNKYINNNQSNTKSFQILSGNIKPADERCDDDEMGYAELIRDNLDMDSLMTEYPHDKEFLQGVYDLILETVLCKSDTIIVASNRYSTNFVKAKLLKLNKFHIEYVMDCWSKLTDVPRNVKKYLLATLFNAPSTSDAFIRAEVNRDMYNPDAPWRKEAISEG